MKLLHKISEHSFRLNHFEWKRAVKANEDAAEFVESRGGDDDLPGFVDGSSSVDHVEDAEAEREEDDDEAHDGDG